MGTVPSFNCGEELDQQDPLSKKQWLEIIDGEIPLTDFSIDHLRQSFFYGSGIPDNLRGAIWCKILNIEKLKAA